MRAALYACLAILVALPAAADTPKVTPEGPVWDTSPGFAFPGADKPKKLRRSLSGIACPSESNGPRRCIAVFDEGGEARYAMIDGTRVIPQPERIVLLAGNGELDAEGAASDGGFAYVTGSHSRKRASCVTNADSRHVYRLALQSDGRVQPSSQPVDDQGRLWRLLPSTQNSALSPTSVSARMGTASTLKASRRATASSISASASRRGTERHISSAWPHVHCLRAVIRLPGCSPLRPARPAASVIC